MFWTSDFSGPGRGCIGSGSLRGYGNGRRGQVNTDHCHFFTFKKAFNYRDKNIFIDSSPFLANKSLVKGSMVMFDPALHSGWGNTNCFSKGYFGKFGVRVAPTANVTRSSGMNVCLLENTFAYLGSVLRFVFSPP